MNFDEEIQKYREKIALLQQKKKELATKQYAKITALLFDTIQKDENFYSDFIKLLEKYKADEILEALQINKQIQNQNDKIKEQTKKEKGF